MKFEIIYSRKIRDAVAVFTIFMFICQYGLTREDVAENCTNLGMGCLG